MEKKHAHGFFEALFNREPLNYRFRIHLWSGVIETIDDPYRFPPLLTDFDHLPARRGHALRELQHAGRAPCRALEGVPVCGSPCGRRTRRWSRVVGDFNDWDTRRHPMRLATAASGRFFMPEAGEGCIYKYYVRSRFGLSAAEGRPVRLLLRSHRRNRHPSSPIIDRHEWQDEAWMERARADELAEGADVGLRSPPGILDAQPDGTSRSPTASWP